MIELPGTYPFAEGLSAVVFLDFDGTLTPVDIGDTLLCRYSNAAELLPAVRAGQLSVLEYYRIRCLHPPRAPHRRDGASPHRVQSAPLDRFGLRARVPLGTATVPARLPRTIPLRGVQTGSAAELGSTERGGRLRRGWDVGFLPGTLRRCGIRTRRAR
jgi:hypothetical protein